MYTYDECVLCIHFWKGYLYLCLPNWPSQQEEESCDMDDTIPVGQAVEILRKSFVNATVPPTQDASKMNMLGVSWEVIQGFRSLIQDMSIDLLAAAAYRKGPISNIAPDDPAWHTRDICEQLIKPITRCGCSYSELLAGLSSGSDDHQAAPANVFVSHAWDCPFEQVCSALETFFDSEHARSKGLTQGNTFFWFDIFSVRQRNSEEAQVDPKPEGWWMDTFLVAIKVFVITSPAYTNTS